MNNEIYTHTTEVARGMGAENNPLQLTFREGRGVDWPQQLEALVPKAVVRSGSLEEDQWYQWVASPNTFPVVATRNEQIVASATLRELGPAEWWIEGIIVGPGVPNHATAQALLSHLLGVFREQGGGIVRTAAQQGDSVIDNALRALGMRHRGSFAPHFGEAVHGDLGAFRQLGPQHQELAFKHLRTSPMYRTNRFAEHYGTLYALTEERLGEWLARPEEYPVLGWRQDNQLRGMGVIALQPPVLKRRIESRLYLSYLSASDDTTLSGMLSALRALAVVRGLTGAYWQMPLGVGLEDIASRAGFAPVVSDEELWVYELPLRGLLAETTPL